MPVEARLVGERERGVGAFAERQRKLVVRLELLVDLASLRGLDGTVLGGQPGTLDFGGFLRVASHQDFASQARGALHTLLLPLAGLRHTGLVQQVLAVFRLNLVGGERLAGAEEHAVRRLCVNLVVVLRVHIDDGAETGRRSLDRAIDKRQLSDVVLVDHAEDRPRLDGTLARVSKVDLVGRRLLIKAIIGNELGSVVLWDATDASERGRQAGRVEAVDVDLELPFLRMNVSNEIFTYDSLGGIFHPILVRLLSSLKPVIFIGQIGNCHLPLRVFLPNTFVIKINNLNSGLRGFGVLGSIEHFYIG